MTDPKIHQDTVIFAADLSSQVELLLDPDPARWRERLLIWLADCRRSPQRALRLHRAEQAPDDLVTFEMSCLAFAADSGARAGVVAHDRGGAVCAIIALNRALDLARRANPEQARELAERVVERRASMRRQIAQFIAQRG